MSREINRHAHEADLVIAGGGDGTVNGAFLVSLSSPLSHGAMSCWLQAIWKLKWIAGNAARRKPLIESSYGDQCLGGDGTMAVGAISNATGRLGVAQGN